MNTASYAPAPQLETLGVPTTLSFYIYKDPLTTVLRKDVSVQEAHQHASPRDGLPNPGMLDGPALLRAKQRDVVLLLRVTAPSADAPIA